MSLKIKKGSAAKSLKSAVEEISGVDISVCLQCKKCSSGCPVTEFSGSSPSEILRRLQLNAGEELLESGIIWLCASCETCYARCPMKIDMAAVMDALRSIAVKTRAPKPEGDAPLFNNILLRMIRFFGRSYDIAAMALYKAGTGSFLKDTDKLPTILKKGKIAILPPRGGDIETVRRIFKKIEQDR
ncbi:MAG: 4Fe-4S dicluster domain-containing protein [Spirochaetota bacterium]